jgi:uncharacterized protein
MPQHSDDSEMSRFDQQGLRRFSARDAVLAVAVTMVLLVIFSGGSVLKAGEEKKPGIGRDILTTVGKPTNWAAQNLPFEAANAKLISALSPNENLNNGGGFDQHKLTQAGSTVPPVTADAFDPVDLGEKPAAKQPLQTMLVAGDSLSQPLDLELARRLVGDGVNVVRDPHPGTGISNDVIVDWGQLSTAEVQKDHPQAVVVFIGANEGYPLPVAGGKQVNCCGPDWAAAFANRARQMMNTYRQGGAAKVYWLTVPTPRDPARQRISHAVNRAIEVAAQPWADQVRIVDTVPIFTPGEKYRDAMPINGSDQIVRESDGIHLNEAGSSYLADKVLERIDQDFTH